MDAPAPHRFVARVIEAAENKIHEDGVAQRFGFSGALVPGVELFARTTTPMVAAWGHTWLSGGRIDLRFRRPVYEGEELLVEVDDGRLTVAGPDGEVRCLGSVDQTADRPALADFAEASAATTVVDPVAGPFGSLHEARTVEENEWYLDAIGEPLPLYREKAWAHPGLLLRLVNKLLSSNVALGPWIHTSSDCHFLGVAQLPAQMAVHGRVTDVGRRGRHDEVRYDAMVLAGDEPVLQVHHTALYRLSAAG
jgi:acyl dehydratase